VTITPRFENNSIPSSPDKYVGGQSMIRNLTKGKMEAHFIVDYRGVNMTGYECMVNCETVAEEIIEKPTEVNYRLWSKKESWGEGGHVPLEGENVTI